MAMTYGSEQSLNKFLKLVSSNPLTVKRYLEAYGWYSGGIVYPRDNMKQYYEELFDWLDELEVNPVTFLYWITCCTGGSLKILKKGPAFLTGQSTVQKFQDWLKRAGPDVQYSTISHFLDQDNVPPKADAPARMESKLRKGCHLEDIPWTEIVDATNQLMGIPCLRQLCDKSRQELEQQIEGGIVWIQ